MTTATAQAPKIVLILGDDQLIVVDPAFFLHDTMLVGQDEIKTNVRKLLKNYDPDRHIAFVEHHANGSIEYSLENREDAPADWAVWLEEQFVCVPKGVTGEEMRDLYAACKA